MGSLVIAAVMVGALSYVVYAANGILDQVAARDLRERHDTLIVGTATALADRLALVAQSSGESGDALPATSAALATPVTRATESPSTAEIPTEPPTAGTPEPTPAGAFLLVVDGVEYVNDAPITWVKKVG